MIESKVPFVAGNALQDVSTFGGAGPARRAPKIRRTVASLTW